MNMRRILDKIEMVLGNHSIQSTDFMDPYERKLAQSILNRFTEISYREMGGLIEAERKIILIYPDYLQWDNMDLPIVSLKIEGLVDKLSHRDFLGGILNLGINREKIGDILIHEGYANIVVKSEIGNFILMNLERIGKEIVKVRQIPLEELEQGKIEYKDILATLSSLRLDVLISGALNLSRKDSQRLVETRRVKVNWEPTERVSKDVEEGDIVSVKGYGRFTLNSIKGFSKKGKIRVEIRLLK